MFALRYTSPQVFSIAFLVYRLKRADPLRGFIEEVGYALVTGNEEYSRPAMPETTVTSFSRCPVAGQENRISVQAGTFVIGKVKTNEKESRPLRGPAMGIAQKGVVVVIVVFLVVLSFTKQIVLFLKREAPLLGAFQTWNPTTLRFKNCRHHWL